MTASNAALLYPTNTDTAELCSAETLVLMTLRLWALPHRYPLKVFPDWRNGLNQSGAGEQACAAFSSLMNILLSYSQRLMDVRCTCNSKLGYDEACLLQTLGMLQANRHQEAQDILTDWVPLPVQDMALLCAMHLAEALRKAQILIPLFIRPPAQIYQFEEFRLLRAQRLATKVALH
jgi:hypothetical protein